MLTETQQNDLEYLRSLDRIIIPKEYTYWCHNTMYMPEEDKKTAIQKKRCWSEIPTESFVVRSEMSFVKRTDRVNEAIDFNRLPSVRYANEKDSLPFQIRVLRPKNKHLKALFEDMETLNKFAYADRGLGDGRHPKLPGKTEVYTIGFAEKDDCSDQNIDIVYAVTADEINLLANLIREATKNGQLPYFKNLSIKNNRAYEEDVATIIEKSQNKSRFFDTNGQPAQYKVDYQKIKESTEKTI